MDDFIGDGSLMMITGISYLQTFAKYMRRIKQDLFALKRNSKNLKHVEDSDENVSLQSHFFSFRQ